VLAVCGCTGIFYDPLLSGSFLPRPITDFHIPDGLRRPKPLHPHFSCRGWHLWRSMRIPLAPLFSLVTLCFGASDALYAFFSKPGPSLTNAIPVGPCLSLG